MLLLSDLLLLIVLLGTRNVVSLYITVFHVFHGGDAEVEKEYSQYMCSARVSFGKAL